MGLIADRYWCLIFNLNFEPPTAHNIEPGDGGARPFLSEYNKRIRAAMALSNHFQLKNKIKWRKYSEYSQKGDRLRYQTLRLAMAERIFQLHQNIRAAYGEEAYTLFVRLMK